MLFLDIIIQSGIYNVTNGVFIYDNKAKIIVLFNQKVILKIVYNTGREIGSKKEKDFILECSPQVGQQRYSAKRTSLKS